MISITSAAFVTIQFTSIGILVFTGKVIPGNIFLKILLLISLVFGLWSMAMMKFKFNIFPELIPGSKLITSGPYRYIRHPMYTAVLAITFIWLIDEFTPFRLTVWMVLLIDLVMKFKHEEKILLERYDNYREYKNRTKKLIPFIY